MNVKLIGKTKKGKQRVKEHGSEWEVVKTVPNVIFSDEEGEWADLESVTTGNRRWVNLKNDLNFTVEML